MVETLPLAAPALGGPIPMHLAVSVFAAPATTSTTPTRRTVTWAALCDRLTRHDRRADKDGPGWSPATFRPDTTRANANVEALSCLVGDLDHCTPDEPAAVRGRLTELGLAAVVYSTFSHIPPDDGRFRIVVPFSTPVRATDWPEVWDRANAHVFNGRNDPQTRDASRMFYLPAAPPDAAVFATELVGLALDPQQFPPVERPARATRPGEPSRGAIDYLGYRALHFVANGAPVNQQRGAALAATRNYLAAGYAVEDTVEAIWRGLQASPCGDPANPWTHADARRLVEDLASKAPSPPRPRAGATPENPDRRNGAHPQPARLDEAADEARPALGDGFAPTAWGNGQRLVALHREAFRYCPPWGKALVWDGQRWAPDTLEAMAGLAKSTIREMYRRAATLDEDPRKALARWAVQSESTNALAAMIKMAQSEPGIPITPAQLDADPWLLNCPNGTVDLRSGALRAHRREDLLTKLAPVAYDPSASCPTWERFLAQILPDVALRAYLQKALGYALTADVREQVLFFLHGAGSNGKSTLLKAVLEILGPGYARQAAPDLLVASQQDRHPTELADLAGVRCVPTIEVGEGKRLAEALLKQLTGGDRLKARRMREDWWEFEPTFKLFLAANHKPLIRGTDWAIWRRIKLIPFVVTIPDDQQDKTLPAALRAEYPGILAWLVKGCLAWQREGLSAPAPVRAATDAYRAEADVFGAFVEDCCVVHPDAQATTQALYTAYVHWAEHSGEKALPKRLMTERFSERGCTPTRIGHQSARGWAGIGLRADDQGAGADTADTADANSYMNVSNSLPRAGDTENRVGSVGTAENWRDSAATANPPVSAAAGGAAEAEPGSRLHPCPSCGKAIPVLWSRCAICDPNWRAAAETR